MVSPPIELGTLSMPDTLILMILALVVFGPRRLPQIGRQIGKLMYEFRKASNDFKFQMEEELRLAEDADRRKKEEAERARNLALNPPAQTIESQAAIGAQESVSAPSHPLYGSGYPEATEPEAAAPAAEEAAVIMPRIQPPSTGAPVPARQGSGIRDQGLEEQRPEEQGSGIRDQGLEEQRPEVQGSGIRDQGLEEQGSGIRDQGLEEQRPEVQGTRERGTEGTSAVAAEETVVAEANVGAEPTPASEPGADSSPTETVTQHG